MIKKDLTTRHVIKKIKECDNNNNNNDNDNNNNNNNNNNTARASAFLSMAKRQALCQDGYFAWLRE